ncbi:MAG: transcriptional regulator [Candidatus Lokiarchaeota archaeon]|nr:transcriptional regulator [Candidatus Lokiarchaeota archaeon]
MANLYLVKRAESLFLKNQIGLTWGNLGSHIAKLEEAGYIEVEKKFKNKKPFTMLALTEAGRKAFEEYRKLMKGIL